MLHLGKPFSAPEKEAFALKYYAAIGDYLSVSSPIPGIYQAVTPDNSMLSFNWKINGKTTTAYQSATFDAYASGIYTNNAVVNLSTVDNTGYIRKNLALTQQSETLQTATAASILNGTQLTIGQSNSILQFDSSDNLINLSNLNDFRFDYFDGGAGKDSLLINSKLANNPSLFIHAASEQTQLIGMNTTAYWATHNFEKIQFSDYSVNTTVYNNAQSIKSGDLSNLESLYVAYFNRIPDADGMDYWISQFKSGMSMKQIGDAFFYAAAQYPQQTGYTDKLSNTDFINIIYKNALGRSEGADTAGLKYWLNELDTGLQSRGTMVLAILNGARAFTGDATWGWVVNLLDNKLAVAHQFSVNWGLNYLTPEASITNGIAVASAITATDTSAALKLIGITEGQIDFA